jgi:uncharacterized protein (DUF58 family)
VSPFAEEADQRVVWSERKSDDETTRHPARTIAVTLGVVLAGLGLVVGRPDLVILVAPLLLGVLWSAPVVGRPVLLSRLISSRARSSRSRKVGSTDSSGLVLAAAITAEPRVVTIVSEGVGLVRLRIDADGHRPVEAVLDARPLRVNDALPQGENKQGDPVDGTVAGDGKTALDRQAMIVSAPAVESARVSAAWRRRQLGRDVPVTGIGVAAEAGDPSSNHAAVTELSYRLTTERTGPQPRVRLDADGFSDGFEWQTPSVTRLSEVSVVLPAAVPLGRVPESRRLRGATGPVDSPRPGDGLEFRDVREMRPGDSWRRIDWRASARTAGDEVWVRGTHATGETVAVLIVDSRDDVGPSLRSWRGLIPARVDEPSSLDLARTAAASLAHSLIEAGARVGLTDLATSRRMLAPASGVRQERRITHMLALSAPVGSPARRVRAPQMPTDAIVYLFTTLLDDESLRLTLGLRRTGHRVIVVDTLPEIRPTSEIGMEIAWRIIALERQARIEGLEAQRVPVIAWAGQARDRAGERLAGLRAEERRRR